MVKADKIEINEDSILKGLAMNDNHNSKSNDIEENLEYRKKTCQESDESTKENFGHCEEEHHNDTFEENYENEPHQAPLHQSNIKINRVKKWLFSNECNEVAFTKQQVYRGLCYACVKNLSNQSCGVKCNLCARSYRVLCIERFNLHKSKGRSFTLLLKHLLRYPSDKFDLKMDDLWGLHVLDEIEMLEEIDELLPDRRPYTIQNRKNYFTDLDAIAFFRRFRLQKQTVQLLLEKIEAHLTYPTNR
ncbi:hypothetical protein FQR65_LT14035 [Abscondita terminalis]|nr:hypothetical protein FQR65_LT14035 [Abscondita terminalis]